MQNDYNNKQEQATADKANEFLRSAEQKGKDVAGNAQEMLKEGKEKMGKVVETIDKQVRENPWPIIAGVAAGSFLLGCLIGRSK